MFYALIFVLFSFINPSYSQSNNDVEEAVKNSVVKVFVSDLTLNYMYPWQAGIQYPGTSGSGFVVLHNKEKKIITNAHVVYGATTIQVAFGDKLTEKYVATVDYLGNDSDLAMLSVADDKFINRAVSLDFSDERIDDAGKDGLLYAIGFPSSGNSGFCVTDGIINKIESARYGQSGKELPRFQTSTTVNPGNSGGPVLDKNNKIVGVAFAHNAVLKIDGDAKYPKYSNSNYVIPSLLVKQFLKDVSDGKYDGVPGSNFDHITLVDKMYRKFRNAPEACHGVCVSDFCEVVNGDLKTGDIVTKFNNYDVDNTGYIYIGTNMLSLECAVSDCQVGDLVNLEIIRDGKEKTICVKIARPQLLLDIKNSLSYYVNGGIVFEVLTQNYIDDANSEGKNIGGLNSWADAYISKDIKQIVFIPNILTHFINLSYVEYTDKVVEKVNNVDITELKDVVTAFNSPLTINGFVMHKIDLSGGGIILLDADKLAVANAEITKTYKVCSDRSEDLK